MGVWIGRHQTRDTAHLMESVAMMLAALDREGRYIADRESRLPGPLP
jgi:hypothetical protein